MKRSMIAAAVGMAMLLTACGSPGAQAPSWTYPARVDGIPVHRVAWNRPLPYVAKAMYILWNTRRPRTYRISPTTAIFKAMGTWSTLRKSATSIYVQPAGLVGGRTGNPAAAYVVEFVGPNLGLDGAPTFTKPTLEFVIAIVDGRSGKAAMAVGGSYPVQVQP